MLSLTTKLVKRRIVLGDGRFAARKVRSHVAKERVPRKLRVQKGAPSGQRARKLALGELEGHLGYFLRRLQIAVFKDFIRTLAPFKLRPAQYSVLVLINANPGRTQAAIGKALSIERARLARLLHELQRRRWIERRRAPGDGRSHALYLTEEGERVLPRIEALTQVHEKQIGEMTGNKRRQLLMKLLKDFG